MQTFNQLFFKKKQIFSYFFKEISEYYRSRAVKNIMNRSKRLRNVRVLSVYKQTI